MTETSNGVDSRALLEALREVEDGVRKDLLAQYRADPVLMAQARARLVAEENSIADVETWLETFAGRAAVLYLLKTLYVRVLEDKGLLRPVRIREGGSYDLFRRLFPNLGYSAYLQSAIDDAARLLPELFAQTPVEIAEPSEPSAKALWDVWQRPAAGGGPAFDFAGEPGTRFIGDLYQDLDPVVRDRYALLQTPQFIEEFILDHTFEPALEQFGLDGFRIIDPTCGSGHFLLGAFERLAQYWRVRLGPGNDARWDAALRAVDSVYGADLNEYACALSRFRLLLAVVRETGVYDLARLASVHFHVRACDALIPWERLAGDQLTLDPAALETTWLARYGTPEERAATRVFFARSFHAVVGNPPYKKVQDKKKRADYKRAWPRSASGKYTLSAPMTERFLNLPVEGGRAGLINANNFCKRSFGKGLIERVLPETRLDLIVDTSGTYIPGHGTPTLMLFTTRIRPDAAHATHVVAGKRGEPSEPADPTRGVVWSTITEHWREVGYEDRWIAVQTVSQADLCEHPWSLGSDEVMRIQGQLESFPRVRDLGAEAGPAVIIIEDDAYIRRHARALPLRRIVIGEDVRDWEIHDSEKRVVHPYDEAGTLAAANDAEEDLWHLRTTLNERRTFVGTFRSNSRTWYEFERNKADRLGAGRLRIVIGEIATNAHFVVDASDAIFTRTAPVLILDDADEETYRDVAAILNSSSLEFWFKQVCFKKGGDVVGEGRVPGEEWDVYFVRNATNVVAAPLVRDGQLDRSRFVAAIQNALDEIASADPASIIAKTEVTVLVLSLRQAEDRDRAAREMLVTLQEELDWLLYQQFGLLETAPLLALRDLQPLARGHRPFEIAFARRVLSGDEETAWFQRNELEPIPDVPSRYTGPMRTALEARVALIESNPTMGLLEQPVYKRRWQNDPWEKRVADAAERWMLDFLEGDVRKTVVLRTTAALVDLVEGDPKAVHVARLARIAGETSVTQTVTRLLEANAIPDNPARLFAPSGLQKYLGSATEGTPASAAEFVAGDSPDWKRVWRLQAREDAENKSLQIPAPPPPFKLVDYAHRNGWSLRGKFNVPNERFIVYDDLSPRRYGWGGWNAAERATATLLAFDYRGREPDGASERPTLDDPRRCGIQFALWDKVDELRRLGDDQLDEVETDAQICGRTCPCDVLHRWREATMPVRGRRRAASEPVTVPPDIPTAPAATADPSLLQALTTILRATGADGLQLATLVQRVARERPLVQAALAELRAAGTVETTGAGRGLRYRLAAFGDLAIEMTLL